MTNIVLVPLPKEEYPAYRSFLEQLFADQTKEAFGLEDDYVLAFSRKTLGALMPEGFETKNARFYRIETTNGLCVGKIWFALEEEHSRRIGFLRYIHIEPEMRRKGYARQAILALEAKAQKEFGVRAMQLNVYGFNEKAQALYVSLGFMPLRINMEKKIGTGPFLE